MAKFKAQINNFWILTFVIWNSCLSSPLLAKVKLGIDVLEEAKFESLKDANVALITNHTGLNSEGVSTVELLSSSDRLRLRSILTPEHGFKGQIEHGQLVDDGMDETQQIPIYSLYGQTTRPTAQMLKGIDTIVYDIQDIGTRFYTYITTMAQALEEAAKHKVRFVVLDRPNPIRGDIIEGDILDPDIRRMTGYLQIPVRYGLTIGELAEWYNRTAGLGAKITVIKMKKWKRRDWYDQTRLEFIPPSPNIPKLSAAVLYPGIGSFEATNISVGRGTDSPFELFGAPWIKGEALCAWMRGLKLPGVLFEPVEFTPAKDIYMAEKCQGVRLIVTDRDLIRPFTIFVHAFFFLYQNYPSDFKPEWEEVRVVTGSNKLRQVAENNGNVQDLLNEYHLAVQEFRRKATSFYLY